MVKDAESLLDPFCFCAGRFVIAALAFSPFLKEAWSNKRLRYAGMELGLWAGLGYLSQAVGLLSTDAGRASFIGTFTVSIMETPESRALDVDCWRTLSVFVRLFEFPAQSFLLPLNYGAGD